MVRRVLKYGTGDDIPQDVVYLCTLVEEIHKERYVWHYFLVNIEARK